MNTTQTSMTALGHTAGVIMPFPLLSRLSEAVPPSRYSRSFAWIARRVLHALCELAQGGRTVKNPKKECLSTAEQKQARLHAEEEVMVCFGISGIIKYIT